MEQTLGKRIAQHRKRMGLTQDSLAERLGITAQAVSKWENDLSCPDIAMLPRLAEIFGITTDELLGREVPPVHEAEVVEEDEDGGPGIHVKNGKWELRWDRGRWEGIAFAALVLWVGIWTLVSRALVWDVSFWSILWPSALMWVGIKGLCKKFSAFKLGCALFGTYFLLDNVSLLQFEIAGELVFPIIIVLLGLGLLIDTIFKPKKKKPRKSKKEKYIHIDQEDHEPQIFYTTDGETFECSTAFANTIRLVSLPRLSEGEINCAFGNLTVDLSGCEAISDDCKIEANCSFGQLVLLVPAKYRLEQESNTAFADFTMNGYPDPDAAVIQLEVNVSFGNIEIRYI